jgi:hypothetical protein
MDNYQVKNYENVYPTQRTRTRVSAHCTQCGNTGKCKKGCGITTTPLNTNSLTRNVNGSSTIPRPPHTLFCNDETLLTPNDPNYISLNQRLAGPANPKTLIAPVVTPPLAALEYWRANNLINHSHINSESQYDTYLSGYQVSNCCDRIDACLEPVDDSFDSFGSFGTVIEGFDNEPSYMGISDQQRPAAPKCNPLQQTKRPIKSPQPTTSKPFEYTVGRRNQGVNSFDGDFTERYSAIKETNSSDGYEGFTCKEGSDARDPLVNQHLQHLQPIRSPQPTTTSGNLGRENFEYSKHDEKVLPEESGWVNTMCGYDPRQIEKSNLPSNLASGNCERDEAMKRYNKNLFTQTIQPDVYTVNEVIEPINSNIGISFTQQFEPVTCKRDERGALTYTEHDPRVYEPKMVPNTPDMSVTEADIYDPRFTGYGTSYRAYTDKNTGQTRFYYDDINAIRMPNYIVRSNIDFTDYADTYGPLHDSNKFGNKYNSNIRALAQDTFLRASLQQRDDLMERLMRKRNSELWETRKYPMRTFGGQKGC